MGISDSSTVFTRHCNFRLPFILLTKFLVKKISDPWKSVKGTWNSSLLKKIKEFWEDEIMKLPETWQNVVEQNGEYVIQ